MRVQAAVQDLVDNDFRDRDVAMQQGHVRVYIVYLVQNWMPEVEWEGILVLDLALGEGRVVEVGGLGDVAGVGLELARGLVYVPALGLHERQVGTRSGLYIHHGAFHSNVLVGLLPGNISYTCTQCRHDCLEIESPSWSLRNLGHYNLLEHLWVVWVGLLEVQQAVQVLQSSPPSWL
jgi:hypothetical protein